MKTSLLILTLFCLPFDQLHAQNQASLPRRTSEYMSTDSLLIMGSIPIQSTVQNLISLLGEPDSTIVVAEAECPNYFYRDCPTDFQHMYWGASVFETCNGRSVVNSIYFDEGKDIFLMYKNEVRLSHLTTVEYMRPYFPNTVEKMGDINVYREGIYQSFSLPDHPQFPESGWMFFFRENTLKRIDYWYPC